MATDQLEQHARQIANLINIDHEIIREGLLQRRRGRRYVVEFEWAPGGSFYRPAIEGPSTILYINQDHPFYDHLYAFEGSTKETRAQIEVFLWTFAVAELQSDQEDAHRYVIERGIWSAQLRVALPLLKEIVEEV